jgi:hypothetical protein
MSSVAQVNQTNIDEAFRTWKIAEATDDELEGYLRQLCIQALGDPTIVQSEITRGITINHIQSARVIRKLEETIKRLDDQNARTQRLVIILTYVAVGVGILQLVAAVIPLFR